MNDEEIVLRQRNWGTTHPIDYLVVQLVNRLKPRIGNVLTEKQAYDFIRCNVTVTVLPLDKDE